MRSSVIDLSAMISAENIKEKSQYSVYYTQCDEYTARVALSYAHGDAG